MCLSLVVLQRTLSVCPQCVFFCCVLSTVTVLVLTGSACQSWIHHEHESDRGGKRGKRKRKKKKEKRRMRKCRRPNQPACSKPRKKGRRKRGFSHFPPGVILEKKKKRKMKEKGKGCGPRVVCKTCKKRQGKEHDMLCSGDLASSQSERMRASADEADTHTILETAKAGDRDR